MTLLVAKLLQIIVPSFGLLMIVGLFYNSSHADVVKPSGANPATFASSSRIQLSEAVAGGWVDWNGNNFFGPCRGDCAISLYGGKEVTTSMERIFFVKYPPNYYPTGIGAVHTSLPRHFRAGS